MKRILLFAICCITASNLFSQSEWVCGLTEDSSPPLPEVLTSNCNRTSNTYLNKYSKMQTYTPDASTPIKTIKISFHFFQKNDGSNMWQNTAGDLARINEMVGWMNTNSTTLYMPSDPIAGVPFIPDSKIRYEVAGYYFYQNDACNATNNANLLLNTINAVDPSRIENTIPIMLTGGSMGTALGFANYPSIVNLNQQSYVVTFNTGANSAGDWTTHIHWLHEIGHNLELAHTYDSDVLNIASAEYIWDVFNQPWMNYCSPPVGLSCYHQNAGDPFDPNFYCTNNWMGGRPLSFYLSPLQLGKMNRSLALKSVRKYIKEMNSGTDAWIVNSNEIWDFDIHMYQDIFVTNGATLTIKCNLSMANFGKIIVDKGSTLIIDGGKASSIWSMWKGIEVWGDRTKSQLTAGAQGKVIMKNGAIIENAIDGIVTIKNNPSGPDWSYTGGVVQAKDSKFINCYKGVVLLSYHNFHPVNTSTLLPNISYFRNCEFLTTGQVNAPANKPDAGIALYDIIGLNILGCDFKNTSTDLVNSGIRGRGIVSYDAKFTVDDLCTSITTLPCTTYKRSAFDGLKHGVYANNSNPLVAAKINHAIFTNNRLDGIYLAGMNYATVTNNDFNINEEESFVVAGLYLDYCKYYSVQNNNFNGLSSASTKVGIYVKDSKIGAHELYRNKFTNLYAGIIPLNDNSGISNTTDGLTMHCNEFIGNSWDIGITGNNPSSIAEVQGVQVPLAGGGINPKKLVRNIYSATCGNENKYFIYNPTYANKLIYHATNIDASTQPLPQPACSDLYVNVITTNQPLVYNQDCPDNTTLNNSTLSAKIVQLGSDVTAQKMALNNLIDGGNTNMLLNAINSNMSTGNLKNLLMSKSPYLSDAVLIAYITKVNTPPNGHIKEVIVANSPLTTDVKVKLDALNIPNGIKQEINAAQKGISFRMRKEAEIIQTDYEKELAVSDKIRYFLNDTLEQNPLDSIISILKKYPRSENSCEAVGAYITKGEFTKAQAIVDSLQAINKLDDFCQFQKTIIALNQTLGKCFTMQTNTALKQEVEAAANDCSKDGCCNAQSLLKQVFSYEYPELRMLPEVNHSMQNFEEENTIASVSGLTIYPNPANNNLNLAFNSDESDVATVELKDVAGRLIETFFIKNGTIIQYNTEKLENAIYLLSISVNGKFVESKKLVIVK